MRLHLIIYLFLTIIFCSCEDKATTTKYPSKGSILIFDSTSGKYQISSEDKKLISAWESFREAMLKSDYKTMRSLSVDSIICFCGGIDDSNIIKVDTFYKKYGSKLFSSDFVSLTMDSSKIFIKYDWDSIYYNAYPFLTTVSNLEKPKVAEINMSFPVPKGVQKGTIGTLTFIETKNTYKFFGYFTIP